MNKAVNLSIAILEVMRMTTIILLIIISILIL